MKIPTTPLLAAALFCALLTSPKSHASMLVGQNLDSVSYFSTTSVFVNSMKQCKPWMTRPVGSSSVWDSGFGGSVPLRNDGYPLSVPFQAGGQDQWVHTMIPIYENGSHRIRVTGTGRFTISAPGHGFSDHTINGSADFTINISGANNLASFDSSGIGQRHEPSHIFLVIRESQSSDPLRNIRVMRPGHHNAGDHAFDPVFKDRLSYYNTVRFMDWQHTNNSTRTAFNVNTNQRGYYTQGTLDGVAMAHIIDLANELQKTIWICVPERMTNQGITDMANFVAQNLNTGLICYVEYSNEVWNSQFTAYNYVNNTFSGNNQPQKYGTRAKVVLDTFKARFDAAGKGNQLRRVLAGQAGNDSILREALVTAGSSTDVVAIAPYFGSNFPNVPNPLPSLDALATDTYSQMPSVRSMTATHRQIAQDHGKTLVCYEGSQHYVGLWDAVEHGPLTARLLEFNRDWRMRNLYRNNYLGDLASRGVANFVHFSLAYRFNKWGSWGSMEWITQPIGTGVNEAGKEWAIRDWKNNNPGGSTPPIAGGGGGGGNPGGNGVTNITLSTGSTPGFDSSFAVGDSVFTDRSFTWASVGTIGGNPHILLPNSEKNNSSSNYLTFTVNQSVTVFVAYDVRATALPSWLSGFTNTGQTLTINGDVNRRLYSRSYNAGTITLGGNRAAPAAGADTSYSVIVVPAGGGGGGGGGGSGLPVVGDVIALRLVVNNQFVCADNAGASPLIANRSSVGGWEKFTVVDGGSGWIGLRSHANNQFVRADNAGASHLIASSGSIGSWERFRFVDAGDGRIVMQAQINNNYVRAHNQGTTPLIANVSSIDQASRFTWSKH